jgi:hypothetical protein
MHAAALSVMDPFDGTTDVDEFITKYEKVARAMEWFNTSKITNLFETYITGKASVLFTHDLTATQKADWDEVRK